MALIELTADDTVTTMIEKIKEEMCDNYCKWAEKAILDDYCVECTMYHTSCAKHGYCHHGERREP